LHGAGEEYVKSTHRSSLKLLGVVGEPIDPEIWEWYFQVIGHSRCPVVDTWWQTETGGILIAPLPGATPLKPGSATRPFFGITPAIVDDHGVTLPENKEGNLVIGQPWPGLALSIYGDHERFFTTYFKAFPGCYLTGDSAYKDNDGYYWIIGRVDDVIKVSGHRLGTAEVESALMTHPQVAEVAVVGIPDAIKGHSIYAFVVLMPEAKANDALKKALIKTVREQISPIATPDVIQWASGLPKTRSGKTMRRILRKIAVHETEDLGDTSTLSNPELLADLIKNAIDHPSS
jgi:acetyl-CoA synthetase